MAEAAAKTAGNTCFVAVTLSGRLVSGFIFPYEESLLEFLTLCWNYSDTVPPEVVSLLERFLLPRFYYNWKLGTLYYRSELCIVI